MSVPARQARPLLRRYGRCNGRGLWTHYRRGVARSLKYAWETLGGPCISSLLFLAVFAVAAGGRSEVVPGIGLGQFIVPGLVLFSLSHAAFENAAISIVYDKMEGMISDILAAPLSPLEILAGYVLSAASVGLLVGLSIVLLAALFVDLEPRDLGLAAGFAAAAALLFALLGTLTGLWADKWEHYAAVEGFLIVPIGFLSGTFYSLEALPPVAQAVIAGNPVFYAVDGVRSGLTGYSETSATAGALFLATLIVVFWLVAWRLLVTGYKVKP